MRWDPLCVSKFGLTQSEYSYDSWKESDIKSWMSSNSLVPTPTPTSRENMLAAIRRHYDEAYVNWNEVTIFYYTT